jgi:alpha-galactosidase
VAVFNRGPDSAEVAVDFAKLGIDMRRKPVRDLWQHRAVRVKGTTYVASVPSHGVVMLRVGR